MTEVKPPALVLAGGKSLRMGAAKAWLPFGNGTLLTHILRRLGPQVSEVALNATPVIPSPSDIRIVADTLPGQRGPLAGILAGLRDISKRNLATHLLTVPSDAPFLPEDLAPRLVAGATDGKIAIAASGGQSHPVFALWPVFLADNIEAWLADPDHRQLGDFLTSHQVVCVEWPIEETTIGPFDPFMNINTPSDLEEARRFLEIRP